MALRVLNILGPRRLRWRLVMGFVLTVLLLQATLTVAERILVQKTLIDSIRQNLEDTVSAGLAGPSFHQPLANDDNDLGTAAGSVPRTTIKPGRTGSAGGKSMVGKQPPTPQSQTTQDLLAAADVTAGLPSLASSLALPDQPVVMLNAEDKPLAQAIKLTGDRQRTMPKPMATIPNPMAPSVIRALLTAASPHVRTLAKGWTGQVPTPDGTYMLVLEPTSAHVLDVTPHTLQEALILLKEKNKGLTDPAANAVLGRLQSSRLIVLIARRLGDTEQTVAAVTAISLGGALVVIVAATLLALLVVGRALRPLAAITRGAERLAQGDYRHRLALVTGSDEVGRLARAFDRMAEAIGTAFATQRRFVADASHELRSPLTALRGYTDVLVMGVADDRATADRVLNAMREDLGRMSRLVDDLLTLARFDAGAPLRWEMVDVAELLNAVAMEGRTVSGQSRNILLEPIAPRLAIHGDRDRLRQVLSNLMGNACAYCPPGGTIWLTATAENDLLSMTVGDNGPGIPADDLARLGERFYRGDTARSRRTGGAGLGLAIARAVVEAYGGTLAISSRVGVGTTATVRLPMSKGETWPPV